MLSQFLAVQAARASPRSLPKAGLGRELAMFLPWRVVGGLLSSKA